MTAFVPTAALAVSSFIAPAPARSPRAAPGRAAVAMSAKSASVPFLDVPPKLATADLPAGAQFDPLGFTNMWDIDFLMEAEIKFVLRGRRQASAQRASGTPART
jgi:hypothetical protein